MSFAVRLPSLPQEEPSESAKANFDKLHYVYWEAAPLFLRKVFRNYWEVLMKSPWEDSRACGRELLENPIGLFRLLPLCRPLQGELMERGDTRMWDLHLLLDIIGVVFEAVPYPSEFFTPQMTLEDLRILKITRNDLEAKARLTVDDETFKVLWDRSERALKSMGMTCDLEKPNIPETLEKSGNDWSEKKAEAFRLGGNELYKKGKFVEAAAEYSKGIALDNLSVESLGLLFSNRSVAYFNAKDFDRAFEDAMTCVTLRPSWFRGYARLGSALDKLKFFTQAVLNLNIAIRLGDKTKVTLDLLNKCQLELKAARIRNSELDPDLPPNTDPEKMKRVLQEVDPYIKGSTVELCMKGENYLVGSEGVPVNFKKAAKFYSKAADRGDALGLYELGLMTKQGKGVRKNPRKGHDLILKAANKNPIAEYVKGFKSQDFGVPQACHAVAFAYEHGDGVDVDLREAVGWYFKALEYGGDTRPGKSAAHSLGNIFNDPCAQLPGIQTGLGKAREFWRLGAYLGCPTSVETLALLFEKLGEVRLAQEWFHFAILKGSAYLETKKGEFVKDALLERNFDPKKFAEELEKDVRRSPVVGEWLYRVEEFKRNCGIDDSTGRFQGIEVTGRKGRAEAIVKHRELLKGKTSNAEPKKVAVSHAAVNLVGLKEMFFKDTEGQEKDTLYKGRVLRVTVIEDVIPGSPAIQLLVEDAKGDVGRVFVHNFPQEENESAQLGYGSRLFILHPNFRKMSDGLYGIRVDNPKLTLKMTLTNPHRCRYCGKATGNKVPCKICRRATYCSKSCIDKDAEELQHSLLCLNVLD